MRSGLELAGRYRLEAPLGRGGMGEVWQGTDLRLRRPVAVKLLPLSGAADQTDVARFRREAEIAAALNHPGITTVFDVDEHTDGGLHLLFLVMELMRGRDLAAVLRQSPGGLPQEQVTGWAAQILGALAAAHRAGVVHRDIKPANLFLTDDGWVKVCDFGISRLADATKITATGSSTGTPLYMAPEQIEGGQVDGRTDLYAFGCVLYQLLTGTTWIDADAGVGMVLHQHLNQAPASPKSVRPEISDGLAGLVLDLLAKQPGDRPADATAVIERLRDLAPVRLEVGEAATPTRPVTFDPPAGGLPQSPSPTPASGPPVAPGDRRAAYAASALAMLCTTGLLAMSAAGLLAVRHGDMPYDVFGSNLWLIAGEATALGAGARLLAGGRPAGRRLVATAGAVTAPHVLTELSRPLDTVSDAVVAIVALLAGLLAVAAVVAALLPATGRWCRHRDGPAVDGPAADGSAAGSRVATAAIVLALACVPGLVTSCGSAILCIPIVRDDGELTALFATNVVIAVVLAAGLVIGVALLFRRREAGRTLTAIAAGVTLVNAVGLIVIVRIEVGDVPLESVLGPQILIFSPLTAVIAAGALIASLLPATRRWCRRTDGAPVRPSPGT